MALLLRRRYPRARLIMIGESMGAAVLMCLAAAPQPPPVDDYVLVAPAVWGRAEMNVLLRASLWVASSLVPGLTVTGRVARVTASDNREAIRRLSQDPRTFGVAGAPFDSLVTSARARVILARGERDPMVSTAELRAHAADAVEIAGCGHNAQVEKPDAIVDLLR